LPGDLSDCIRRHPDYAEILVAGSAEAYEAVSLVRDRLSQAVIHAGQPIKFGRSPWGILDDQVARGLIATLGVGLTLDPEGRGLDLAKLRYSRIVLIHSAGKRGKETLSGEIRFFHTFMRPLITLGFLAVAASPFSNKSDREVFHRSVINPMTRTLISLDDKETWMEVMEQAEAIIASGPLSLSSED